MPSRLWLDSGADAVMIGRAVQGRPWLPGQIARYFATGARDGTPSLAEQFNLIDALYDEMLNHHGLTIGRRHARKHLGWALNAAASRAEASAELLKHHRNRVLTAEEPKHARQMLAEAFDDFGRRARGMTRAQALSAIVHSPADAMLHALPHPVIMVAPDGKIADANVAAEQFFDASTSMLRRHSSA